MNEESKHPDISYLIKDITNDIEVLSELLGLTTKQTVDLLLTEMQGQL